MSGPSPISTAVERRTDGTMSVAVRGRRWIAHRYQVTRGLGQQQQRPHGALDTSLRFTTLHYTLQCCSPSSGHTAGPGTAHVARRHGVRPLLHGGCSCSAVPMRRHRHRHAPPAPTTSATCVARRPSRGSQAITRPAPCPARDVARATTRPPTSVQRQRPSTVSAGRPRVPSGLAAAGSGAEYRRWQNLGSDTSG